MAFWGDDCMCGLQTKKANRTFAIVVEQHPCRGTIMLRKRHATSWKAMFARRFRKNAPAGVSLLVALRVRPHGNHYLIDWKLLRARSSAEGLRVAHRGSRTNYNDSAKTSVEGGLAHGAKSVYQKKLA